MSKEEKKFLKKYSIDKYDRPSVAADIVVLAVMNTKEEENYRKNRERRLKVLLIRRGEHPYKQCWALPGGFLRPGETLEETAVRELREETGVDSASFILSGINAQDGRDPRGWIISTSYISLIDGNQCNLRADTDAWEAAWFSVDVDTKPVANEHDESMEEQKGHVVMEHTITLQQDGIANQNNIGKENTLILKAKVTETVDFADYHRKSKMVISESEDIAFDHAEILLSSILKLRDIIEHDMRVAFDFLPEEFTLAQLQEVVEQVLGRKLLTANFRRKIADYVVESERYIEGEGHRPAKLFTRNEAKWRYN